MRRTPLTIGSDLAALAAVESLPDVRAVNIDLPSIWDCLWANYFLLHKRQYIVSQTYEGRPTLAPQARWELRLRFPSVRAAGARDLLAHNATYMLVDRRDPLFARALIGKGWYPAESLQGRSWYWFRDSAQVFVDNPQPGQLAATVRFSGHSLHERRLRLRAGERTLWEGQVPAAPGSVDGIKADLAPGRTTFVFDSPEPPEQPPGEERALTYLLDGFVVDVQSAPAGL